MKEAFLQRTVVRAESEGYARRGSGARFPDVGSIPTASTILLARPPIVSRSLACPVRVVSGAQRVCLVPAAGVQPPHQEPESQGKLSDAGGNEEVGQ